MASLEVRSGFSRGEKWFPLGIGNCSTLWEVRSTAKGKERGGRKRAPIKILAFTSHGFMVFFYGGERSSKEMGEPFFPLPYFATLFQCLLLTFFTVAVGTSNLF